MGVNKFFVFKEDGTLTRLKSSISRFLDNDPPVNDDKVNIRASISVPASAEGLTPANNLSDVSSAATSRANLSVNSTDEDAAATGTKLVGPALYFDGTNDYVQVADDDKFSFTNGTDDLPFTVSAWVNMMDATSFPIAAKFTSVGEYLFLSNSSDKLRLRLITNASNFVDITSTATLTAYEGKWVNLAVTYAGAGPNSANAFSAADSSVTLYVNGVAVAKGAASKTGTYAGMSNTTEALRIGEVVGTYAKGHISSVKIFNRCLTATEVVKSMTGDLGFSDEYGGAIGGIYSSDFSAGTDGFNGIAGTAAGNIDSIGGQDNNLRFTVDATNSLHYLSKNGVLAAKKWNTLAFDYYAPSSNSILAGLQIGTDNDLDLIAPIFNLTQDAWTRVSFDFVSDSANLRILTASLSSTTYQDTGGDDVLYIRNLKVTEIGVLADLRAEDFNSSSGKWLDRSTNNFVGVNNGATLVGKRRHISAATLNLTSLPTSSAGLSAGEVWNNSGVLTIV